MRRTLFIDVINSGVADPLLKETWLHIFYFDFFGMRGICYGLYGSIMPLKENMYEITMLVDYIYSQL